MPPSDVLPRCSSKQSQRRLDPPAEHDDLAGGEEYREEAGKMPSGSYFLKQGRKELPKLPALFCRQLLHLNLGHTLYRIDIMEGVK